MKLLHLALLLAMNFALSSCQEMINVSPTAVSSSTEAADTGTIYEVSDAVIPQVTGHEGDFMARIKAGYAENSIQQLFFNTGITIKNYIPRFRMVAFSASYAQINTLLASPIIEAIQVDVKIPMSLSTATTQVRAREVRDQGVEGEGARVCIIDSGLNYHNDLAIPEQEYDFVDSDYQAEDVNGHGTAVAGIISSMAEDLAFVKGNSGVAPRASLLIAKVFGEDGLASGSTIAAALDWCASNNAHVINMSLGHGGFTNSCDSDFTALFSNQTADLGIVVVAASGNDGFSDRVSSPACGSKVVGVGSVNKQDMKSGFSNAGSQVDLTAPGENIITTNYNGGYSSFSGTSAATPFVAGAAALLKSMQENPSAYRIKEALIRNAKDLGASGKDYSFGNGRLDVAAAYDYIKSSGDGGTTGGTTGLTTGGSTGGSTGGVSGGTTGGTTGGITPTPPTKFTLESITTTNESRSNSYRSSHKRIVRDCPSNHYLSDISTQGQYWYFYPSITWFRLECQALSSLDTSTQVGKKKGGSASGNLCDDKKAITAMDVRTGSNIKDIRPECASLSYDSNEAGSVKIKNHTVSRYALGRSFFLDDKDYLSCPDNTVAVGIDASYKSDSDEWAFTRVSLRCAKIRTSH